MHHGGVEGDHVLDSLRLLLRAPLEVLVQAAVPLAPCFPVNLPELLAEVLANERVGVQPMVLTSRGGQ